MKVSGTITAINVSGSISGGVQGSIDTTSVRGSISGGVRGASSKLDVTGAITESGVTNIYQYSGILTVGELMGLNYGWDTSVPMGSITPEEITVNEIDLIAIVWSAFVNKLVISPNIGNCILKINGQPYVMSGDESIREAMSLESVSNPFEEGKEYAITII